MNFNKTQLFLTGEQIEKLAQRFLENEWTYKSFHAAADNRDVVIRVLDLIGVSAIPEKDGLRIVKQNYGKKPTREEVVMEILKVVT